MKTVRNFLIANCCAVLPLLWLGIGWMPDQVKIEVRGNGAEMVTVVARDVVLQGQENGKWEGGTVWKFYLREGMEWQNLAFRLAEGLDESCIGLVRLEKWKLLAWEKPGTELKQKREAWNEYYFPTPRFAGVKIARGKMPLVLAGAELLLLGLSWWVAKHHLEERWWTLLPSAMGVAFSLTLLMQIALPVQSYISNRSAFPFTPWELGVSLSLRFVFALALGGACLVLLSRGFGRWVLSLAFAVAVCAYLESGILSEGLPSLTGDWSFFADRMRGMKDAMVWGGVFVLVLGLHRWLKPWLGCAGLCLAFLSAAAILDAKPEHKVDTSNLIVSGFSSFGTVIRSVTYSANRNVMVFIIDSLEREQAHSIMEDSEVGAELREKFRGFTEYTNNVGACEFSLPAVANLLTGNYPSSTMDPDFYESIYGDASVLKDYLEFGYAVYSGTTYCYTNRKQEVDDKHKDKSIWKIPQWGKTGQQLAAFCRFRWIPFIAKAPYAWLVGMSRQMVRSDRIEKTVYPMLAAADVSRGEKGVFCLIHTDGVHIPISFDRHGKELPQANNSDEGCIESGIFIMNQLGDLMDAYRKKGIFDDALIIVLADHGHHGYAEGRWGNGEKNKLPGNARPCLWIKPPHCAHSFTANGMPTTHAKIVNVLREAMIRDLDDSEIQKILSGEDRLYRHGASPYWHDYHVASDGSWRVEIVEQSATGNSELRPIQLGTIIPLKFDVPQMRELSNIRFRGFPLQEEGKFIGWRPNWTPFRKTVEVDFKVPSLSQGYRVCLRGSALRNAVTNGTASRRCVHFSAQDNNRTSVEVCEEGMFEVVFDAVTPDEDGIIEIVGERDEECMLNLVLTQLRVTAAPM